MSDYLPRLLNNEKHNFIIALVRLDCNVVNFYPKTCNFISNKVHRKQQLTPVKSCS